MDEQYRSLFFEKLRFAGIRINHAKKFCENDKWHHNHILNADELYYVFSGSFYMQTEKGKFLVDANKFAFIPANTYKSIYVPKGTKVEFFAAQFVTEINGEPYFKYADGSLTADAFSRRDEIHGMIEKLDRSPEPFRHYEVFKRIAVVCELLSIFIELSEMKAKDETKKSSVDFSKIQSHINRYYRFKPIKVSELAEIANVSEGYFRRQFKKYYGVSCKEYIDSLRINGVLKMLRESDASLKTIAENFQYSDSGYLIRIIKKHTGMTPTEYRKLNKK